MGHSKIWQSFGELNRSNAFENAAKDEFKEELTIEPEDNLLQAKTPRRDFLKFLGFSTAAASLAASCETPVRKAIPYVNKPESITPGVANWYATTYIQDGDVLSIIAKVRDGRPIKIEGNEQSPITAGATSARAQASVLDLYDTARLRFPMKRGGRDGQGWSEISTFEAVDRQVTAAIAGVGSAPIVLLTSSINSPSTKQLITEFLAKYPGSRHVQYDAVSYSGMLLANEASYGKRAIPSYDFGQAKVMVSLAADFLGTWLSPTEFSKQYAAGRRIDERNPVMSKHYQFESILSMTGANADERFTHRPSETGMVALALLNAVNGQNVNIADAKLKAGIVKAARDLNNNKGAALVVSGSNDVNVQTIVNAINEVIGANGKTINWATPYNYRLGIDTDMVRLINDMNNGAIGAIMIAGPNPVYNHPMAAKFKSGLAKVKLSISFNEKMDETSELCQYIIPTHHYLESWGDAEPKAGYYSLIQPTIYPLFKTRAWQESLLKWSGSTTTNTTLSQRDSTLYGSLDSARAIQRLPMAAGNEYLAYLQNFWINKLGSVEQWDLALRDGVINPGGQETGTVSNTINTVIGGGASFNASSVATATAAINAMKPSTSRYELVLYEKTGIGCGQQGNNPWLHELPDPITKATWDNYAIISAATAEELLGINMTDNGELDDYESHPEKWVITVQANGKEISLPTLIIPGVQNNTIGIALGYGRGMNAPLKDADSSENTDLIKAAQAKVGKAGAAVGQNAFPMVGITGNTFSYIIPAVTVTKQDYKYQIAQNQIYHSYTDSLGNDRVEVVRETSMATYKQHPEYIKNWRKELQEEYAPKTENFRDEGTLYNPKLNERPGIHWGMSIDLNSCTGCGACVVACNVENNISVVGKREVLRGHEMHWLRIDRYFVTKKGGGPDDLVDVVFQPMLCQHCDNAPCENVCPVLATTHNSEGINQMAYNRCIGTKYCANNCPYKVRRFNWADYNGADSFPDNQEGIVSDATLMMNDDLTRMVLNPDVTVRSRGVMEKCSFCVQRLQEGKLQAKKNNRPLIDGEVKTACQQACANGCFVFGDYNDRNSAVRKIREQSPNRLFYALEQLHALPNVSYLAKIRNTDELLEVEEHGTPVGEGEKEEPAKV
jgi:MoCo/4Fe-4S cofactor protein with predicted Tat translocation signal